MSIWAEIFLGIIAVATLLSALVLVSVWIAAARLARHLSRVASEVEHELKPLLGHLNAIGRDASRAAGLAAAQVERVDQLANDLVNKLEHVVGGIQAAVAGPAKEGRAFWSGMRAALGAVLEMRRARARQRGDDEDALFI